MVSRRTKLILIILAIIILDQSTKSAARTIQTPIRIIPEILSIATTINTGASFGIFQDFNLALLIVGILFTVGLAYYLFRQNEVNSADTAFALILAGAIGNVMDRIMFGFVTDFIALSFWPTFNLADSAITIGAALLLIQSRYEKN